MANPHIIMILFFVWFIPALSLALWLVWLTVDDPHERNMHVDELAAYVMFALLWPITVVCMLLTSRRRQ